MKGILKNMLLFMGGITLGSFATQRAILRAVESKDYILRQDEVVFETRKEAELVLEQLQTVITTYGNATVADFCDLAGLFNSEMTRFGWTSVDSAKIVHTADGYVIKLPKPLPITYEEEP